MSISALKKNRAAVLAKLQQAAEKQAPGGGGGQNSDERLWRPFFDKERGIGSATVRFLPQKDTDGLPWSKVIRHAFKSPTGKWYIENSPRTLNQSCPVSILNGKLWNSGIESDKDVARAQKQKIEYTTNVLIIKDPANPENEGKVMLYRFGPMIYKIIEEQMFPKFDDQEAVNPFDPWSGADFNIRIVGKQLGKDLVPNYEKSTFASPSALGEDDYIEEVFERTYDLGEFTSEANFKSFEVLQRRLFEVLGPTAGSGVPVIDGELPTESTEAKSAPAKQEKVAKADTASESSEDGEDELDYLKQLVADL